MEISDLELQSRYQEVFDQFVALAPQLANTLEKYGRVRNELHQLVEEMHKRRLPTNLEYPPEAVPSATQESTS